MREAVRSGRRANFYITENSFIDHYARDVGTTGVAVYHVLERHVNCETRSTWIGTAKMAKLLNVDQRTIQRTIKKLESLRLIRIVRSENMTTFFIVPVPPPAKTTSAPLFDEMPDSLPDDPDTGVATTTPESPAPTFASSTATYRSHGATLTPHPSDIPVAPYKEEQDLSNKTQEQDLRGNKTSEQDRPLLRESAKRLLRILGLPDSVMTTASAALEAKAKQMESSLDTAVIEIATAANHAKRRNVPCEKFLEDFVAQVSAQGIIEYLSLTATNTLTSVVTAAVKAELRYAGLSVEEAAASITRAASEDRQKGMRIDKFYFEDAKWRNHGRPGKGQQQFERIKRARDEAHAIIDAQMDH